ncbi:MAG: apolipoprotein N-acyltransferase [Gammaproteobacteria bacterium]
MIFKKFSKAFKALSVKTWAFLGFSLLAGCLHTLSMAPYGLWPLGLLSVAGFYITLEKTKPLKQALSLGLLYGLGYFGTGISWIFVSVYEFGQTPTWFASLSTGLLIFVLALYFVLFAYAFKKLLPKTAFPGLKFASLWVLMEYLRSWLFTGFPWALLGQGQVNGIFMALFPWIGIFGVSFITALCASLYGAKKWFLASVPIVLAGFFWGQLEGKVINHSDKIKTVQKKFSLSIVQPNIKPAMKFDPEKQREQELLYHTLSELHPADLVIWPESATTIPYPDSKVFMDNLDASYKAKPSSLILGAPLEQKNRYYNSLFVLGQSQGLYSKRQLVPFGDFVPFEDWFRGLFGAFDLPLSSFQAGPAAQATVKIQTQNFSFNIAPLICYEIIFPDLVRQSVQEHKADVIVNISEDGWFGTSIGPKQHFEMARIRSLENGIPVLRATSTGISAVIYPNGRMKTIPAQTTKVLHTDLVLEKQVLTAAFKIAPLHVALFSLALVLLLLLFAKLGGKNRPLGLKSN